MRRASWVPDLGVMNHVTPTSETTIVGPAETLTHGWLSLGMTGLPTTGAVRSALSSSPVVEAAPISATTAMTPGIVTTALFAPCEHLHGQLFGAANAEV